MSEQSPNGMAFGMQSTAPLQTAEGLTAAIYARTSSPGQQHGYSLNEQVRQCWQRCDELGWTVSHVYRDEAVSGKDTDREMFQKLLSAAEQDCFDVVLVWKLDRFSRSLMHAVKLEQRLRDWEVGLHSVTEQIDTTTPTGRFNFRSISSASELERDLIKQRSQMGLRALALEHKWPNDNPPVGYTKQDDGTLEIVEPEAEFVREIFTRYIEVQSMPNLAEELNAQNRLEYRKSKWTPYAVGEILKNQLYIGEYSVAGIHEYVEEYQILPESLFEKVTAVRTRFQSGKESKRQPMSKDRKNRYIKKITTQYSEYLEDS
ncbi:recombinase family protein [Haloplanus ruber]|uniref:Recombinase family protein n=1 Tax=Haloplanus ruber TaxID=869892 RepID=A0ABD6D3L8_9EURY|nr:recombinase family protein [Haloplanus ruber]